MSPPEDLAEKFGTANSLEDVERIFDELEAEDPRALQLEVPSEVDIRRDRVTHSTRAVCSTFVRLFACPGILSTYPHGGDSSFRAKCAHPPPLYSSSNGPSPSTGSSPSNGLSPSKGSSPSNGCSESNSPSARNRMAPSNSSSSSNISSENSPSVNSS